MKRKKMSYDIDYQRVIPRDFFNEAKLLKCMGRMALLIHDELAPKNCKIIEISDAPLIGLSYDGALAVVNYPLFISGIEYHIRTTYNSKGNYPAHVMHEDVEVEIFDDDGSFTQEFIELCKGL